MPTTICTLPRELLSEIFGDLEQLSSAIALARTCKQMYIVWVGDRSDICFELLPTHPLLNRCLYPDPTSALLDEYSSLWRDGLYMDYKYHGVVPRDGFKFAERILIVARGVRRAATEILGLIRSFQLHTEMNYLDLTASLSCMPFDEGGWAHYGEVAIARLLYRLLVHLHEYRYNNNGFQVAGHRDFTLYALATFIANFWRPDWGFPNITDIVSEDDISEHWAHGFRLIDWYFVMMGVRNHEVFRDFLREGDVAFRHLGIDPGWRIAAMKWAAIHMELYGLNRFSGGILWSEAWVLTSFFEPLHEIRRTYYWTIWEASIYYANYSATRPQ
ncbi:hypothetical protein FN846DRAFT_943571 [Sphaerosporella brunnea]|uniref:F-box domain-containing protein n=1 Tax=Sphaerosporella brunnea TaxID=1250544 RepID=A0A5J5F0J6_9PEZI|nr:hypothetical protein FN846DRAFT_943571 [Sphaerosporella brunnea]